MIHSIIETTASLFDVVFLMWFVPNFLGTKFYKQKWYISLLLAAEFALIIIADFAMQGFDLVAIFGALIISACYALLISNKKWFNAFFASTTYILVIMFGGSIVFMFFTLVLGNDTANEVIGNQSSVFQRLIYLIIGRLFQFIVYQIILIVFRKGDIIGKKNGVFVLLYSVISIIGLGALMTISVNDYDGQNSVSIFTIMLMLMFSCFATFFMLNQVIRFQKKEAEEQLIKMKMKSEKVQAEKAEIIWENIRSIRHDMKNHFTIIKSQLDSGDISACKEYVNKLNLAVDSFGEVVHTGNSIIDALVNTKLYGAQEIHFLITGFPNMFADIEDADLVSLLGNIIDNAIEAVQNLTDQTNKYIELHLQKNNQNRIIICKNTIEKTVLECNQKLKSSKKTGDHGLGHKIVSSIAEKYGGFVEYIEENCMFCVQIVLPQ